MNKPVKPNITIPASFADNGVKAPFDNDHMINGFPAVAPDVLAGDALNEFIDNTYKGLNYSMAASDALNLINEGETLTVRDGKFISGASGSLHIGQIISMNCTANYVPDGCLPTDGTEYTQTQFTGLWNNYLTANLLNTCTYTEYEQELATYGQCSKFAVDEANGTFRVPFIKDGSVIQQALTDGELGKAYNAGLPNVEAILTLHHFTGNSGPHLTATGAFKDSTSKHSVNAAGSGTSQDIYITNFDFKASNSNPIYGNSDTVQMNAVALRYFVVVANGQINESMMDWSAWASSLQGKVSYSDLEEIGQGGTGFYKLNDGLIVQWGSLTISAETAVVVTLPTPYSSTNYMVVQGMYSNSSSGSEKNWQTSTLTTTSFKAHNGQGGSCTFGWIAVGF